MVWSLCCHALNAPETRKQAISGTSAATGNLEVGLHDWLFLIGPIATRDDKSRDKVKMPPCRSGELARHGDARGSKEGCLHCQIQTLILTFQEEHVTLCLAVLEVGSKCPYLLLVSHGIHGDTVFI